MGARIEASETYTPPLRIFPAASGLHGIEYEMPIASAQVKSCLLLAGLYADGDVCVKEPAETRDHTERMLGCFGHPVSRRANWVCLRGGEELRGALIEVPGDLSSAAFFLVAASIAEGSDLLLTRVGVNPTRSGVLDILGMMGADLVTLNRREAGGEPIADIRVRSARLRGVDIPAELVPLAIDEFPALFIAAACAEGRTVLRGAAELRVKESDRIESMAKGLRALGVRVDEAADGLTVHGGRFSGGQVDSFGDHRVAMAFAVAGIKAGGELRITDCANVATSFPGFCETARRAGVRVVEQCR
jgi:3-phosphoshikimate 1-carboxyvinyltransferase